MLFQLLKGPIGCIPLTIFVPHFIDNVKRIELALIMSSNILYVVLYDGNESGLIELASRDPVRD